MWPPPWLSSPRREKPLRRHSSFSCSSFKDIQTLFREDEPDPKQPRSPSVFHRVGVSAAVLRAWANNNRSPAPNPAKPPVTLYFTSLRVVRRTYEDCRAVRAILRGLRVHVDERDLSMDGRFVEELKEIAGQKKPPRLPCVLIGGRLIGGAEEVRQLNETGELKRLLGSCRSSGSSGGACDACGGFGYTVCEECCGSHRIYSDKTTTFRSCTACNVSGLIRCPSCSVP